MTVFRLSHASPRAILEERDKAFFGIRMDINGFLIVLKRNISIEWLKNFVTEKLFERFENSKIKNKSINDFFKGF